MKETLEDVAERTARAFDNDNYKALMQLVVEGAEWQQKQMYREEEVENIIYKLFEDYASNYTNKALEEFEKFKKK